MEVRDSHLIGIILVGESGRRMDEFEGVHGLLEFGNRVVHLIGQQLCSARLEAMGRKLATEMKLRVDDSGLWK